MFASSSHRSGEPHRSGELHRLPPDPRRTGELHRPADPRRTGEQGPVQNAAKKQFLLKEAVDSIL